MKKISNREEANNYYKLLNSAIDDFSNKTKSRPSEMHKYLSNNKRVFLKRLELDDVDGVEGVLNDILLHKKHMEDDKVITFEKYTKLNENLFEISPPTIEYEKALADYFNTSLGHIDLIDSQTHLYKINDFGKEVYSVILNKQDVETLKRRISESIKSDILNKILKVDSIDNVPIGGISFWVSEFVDNELLSSYVESKVSMELVFNIILRELSLKNDFLEILEFIEFNGFYISVP